MIPLSLKQLDHLNSIFSTLSNTQLAWLSGYLWKLSIEGCIENHNNLVHSCIQGSTNSTVDVDNNIDKITIISASQTGNAHQLAKQLYNTLIVSNLHAKLFFAKDYKFKQISKEKLLIFITSTYGEGEPPEEAILLYKYLFSKKACSMNDTYFSVLSLGDRSYEYFSKAGKDFDRRLEELGAHRLYQRVDLDIDFQESANIWIKDIVMLLRKRINSMSSINSTCSKDDIIFSNKKHSIVYTEKYPFIAYLSDRQKITSRSSLKDVYHLEIDISGSNICYCPGDALGIWYENDLILVDELLDILNLSGTETVQVNTIEISLKEALLKYYELTQNNFFVVKNVADISQNSFLLDLLHNKKQLKEFIKITPLIDMIRNVSLKLSPKYLLKILKFMKPRFYSIASSQSEVGEEIHITVGVIRYEINGRIRSGGASSYLVDRLKESDEIRIFIQSNNNFRLPKNYNTSIIMIGAGTGIAPFRAFMQQRMSDGTSGKNWLFFGNLRFIDDFLYQVEWQKYVKDGILNKIDTAWSRDQDHKIYVQDKLLNNGVEVWRWIQEGACVYVCGDAHNMARDVEKALLILTVKYGNMTLEKANEFWDDMRLQQRYQRDIY